MHESNWRHGQKNLCDSGVVFPVLSGWGEADTPSPHPPLPAGTAVPSLVAGLTDSRTRPHGAPQHRDERALPGGSTALPLGAGKRASKTRNVTVQKMLVLMLSDTRPGQVNLRQTGKPFMINECP